MRLFFAVTLPEEIIERVSVAQASLREAIGDDGVKWTRPDQFHYTLKFLGETPPPRARRAVDAALVTSEGVTPFEMVLGGVGAFPNSQRPSTLWVGATAGGEALAELAARLDGLLVKQGFQKENRPLKAHLTLARIKGYAGEVAAARALKTADVGELGSAAIDRFVLMHSTLKPTGSVYAVVEEFPFK